MLLSNINSLKKKVKLLSFENFINTNSHISGDTKWFFTKFKSFVFGLRYDKYISVVIKNIYMIKLFLYMNIYSIYKYGLFCFICLNPIISKQTKKIAMKVQEGYLTSIWVNGFLTNFKYVKKTKELILKKNYNFKRLPSIVFFDSLRYKRVSYILDECNLIRVPSLSILETNLYNFNSSYFTVANSDSISTYMWYLFFISSNIFRCKNSRFFSLFKNCVRIEHKNYVKTNFRFFNLHYTIKFYTRSLVSKFMFNVAKKNSFFLNKLFFLPYLSTYNFIRYFKLFEKKKRWDSLILRYKRKRKKKNRKITNIIIPGIFKVNKKKLKRSFNIVIE